MACCPEHCMVKVTLRWQHVEDFRGHTGVPLALPPTPLLKQPQQKGVNTVLTVTRRPLARAGVRDGYEKSII
jgi:hypothetical protein